MSERLSRRFWAVTDGLKVRQVTGYQCPENESYWWVPELGYSMPFGHSLFDTEEPALDKAIDRAVNQRDAACARLQELLLRKGELEGR